MRLIYGFTDLRNYGTTEGYARLLVNKTTSGGFAGAAPDLRNYGSTEGYARLLVNKTTSGGFAGAAPDLRIHGSTELWNLGFAEASQTTRLLVNKTTSGGFARATPDLRIHESTELRNYGGLRQTTSQQDNEWKLRRGYAGTTDSRIYGITELRRATPDY